MAPSVFFLLCSGRRQQSLLSFMQCVHDVSLCCCIGASEGVVCRRCLWKLTPERKLWSCYGSRRVAGTGVLKHSVHVDRPGPASFRSICDELIQVDDSFVSRVKRFLAASFETRGQFMYMNFRFMTRFEHILKVLQAVGKLIYFKLGIDTSGEHWRAICQLPQRISVGICIIHYLWICISQANSLAVSFYANSICSCLTIGMRKSSAFCSFRRQSISSVDNF